MIERKEKEKENIKFLIENSLIYPTSAV